MNNVEKTKVLYSKAVKLSNVIYKLLDEDFAETPIVVYSVDVNRWNDHVEVDVWATIGHGKVDDKLREIVGSVCRRFSFSPWSKGKASDFLNEVKEDIKPFIRKAKNVQKKRQRKQRTMNQPTGWHTAAPYCQTL